jgi:hypothetical protein
MRVTWDLHHFEQKDQINEHYHGDNIVDEHTEMITIRDYFPTWKRRILTDGPLFILAITFIVGIFNFTIWLSEDMLERINPEQDSKYTIILKQYFKAIFL